MKLTHFVGGLLLALLTSVAHANLVVLPRQLVVDSNGDVRSGAKLYVYDATTTTPRAAYTTSALSVAHSVPVLSLSTGLFPAIYVSPAGGNYKLVLKDSNDVTLWTEDNIEVGESGIEQQDVETDAGVSAVNLEFPVGYSRRYNATCDGVADDTAEIQATIDVAQEGGTTALIQSGTCLVDTLTIDASNFTIEGEGRGSILKASTNIPASGAILLSLAGGADTSVNQALLDGIYGSSVQSVRTNVTGSLENVQIKNLTFEGNSVAVRGIWATGFTRGSTISGNYFDNIDGCGVCLNGSWSFTILANHFEGDATHGTGIGLGQVSHGERGGSAVVNAATIIGNEVTAHANGLIWNFGVGGFVGGNTFESNVTDGFASQSVEGISVTGNYFEGNGGDNIQMGGTLCDAADLSTDCAESWFVAGNRFNSAAGNNIRMQGVINSVIGPNDVGGTVTQHFFIPNSGGGRVAQNQIVVPEVNSTYVSNSSELSASTNFITRVLAGSERYGAPRISVATEFRHGTSATLGFFGTSPTTQQADPGALTDSTTGTANNTVTDVGGSFNQGTLNNNFADLTDQINLLRAILRAYGLAP